VSARPSNPLARLFGRKDIPGIPGQNAGWMRPGSGVFQRGGLPRRLSDYLATYGGTDDAVVWVYACVSLIASEGAAYPYEIITEDGDQLDESDVPDDLQALLDNPNETMTYFDFSEYVYMDLELAGNSYWLKDQRNALGQPAELLRLRPDLVQIAVDVQDRVVGYVYNIQNRQIPYDLDEVLRFRTPNPLDDKYGMGTVEAIQRSLGADLAETEHISGFFNEGARISGILTTSDTLSEIQFERMRTDFESQFKAGGQNQFGIMIAEQGNTYTPISTVPASSGVTELRRMGKDEILSGFGIPEFLLGGIGQGGIYKMSEAQHIFSRAMMPRARRFSEKLTADLVSMWEGLEFRVDVTITEPTEDKIANAKQLLGMGASLNQVLDAAGMPPIDDDQADEPLLQSGILPFSVLIEQAAAQIKSTDLANQQTQQGIDQVGQSNGSGFDPSGGGGFGGGVNPGDIPPEGPSNYAPSSQLSQLSDGDLATLLGQRRLLAPRPRSRTRTRTRLPGVKAVELPDVPGYERCSEAKAAHTDGEFLARSVNRHRRALKDSAPKLQKVMLDFFVQQRMRVIGKLGAAVSKSPGAVVNFPTKQTEMDQLWDAEAENEALLEAYMPLVDEIGQQAVGDAQDLVSANLAWDLANPLIGEVRGLLAQRITNINETTRRDIAAEVETGMRRGYSVSQIANGFEAEGYRGVMGVFDNATAARAETIARTETSVIYNTAAIASYRDAGIVDVEVVDGHSPDTDAACRAANGQRWHLDYAVAHPNSHPNCVRSFVPIVALTRPGLGGRSMRRQDTKGTAQQAFAEAFDEAEHPRDRQGRFRLKPGTVVRVINGLHAGAHGIVDSHSLAGIVHIDTGQGGLDVRADQVEQTPRRVYLSANPPLPAEISARIESEGLDEPGPRGPVAQKLLGPYANTQARHSASYDDKVFYSPVRHELHKRILDYYLQRHDGQPSLGLPQGRATGEYHASQETPRALFMSGGTASGKSTALGAAAGADDQGVVPPDSVWVDPDQIKEMLPEFQELSQVRDPFSSSATHEESSDVAKWILREATKRKLNVVLDGTGDSGGDTFQRKLSQQKNDGYKVEVFMVDAPLNLAIERMVDRGDRTGRYVPVGSMKKSHYGAAGRHLLWRSQPLVDRWQVWSSNVGPGEDPILAAQGGRGKYVVLDAHEYNRIVRKGEDGIQEGY
jgi:HK97 family phage portal protein